VVVKTADNKEPHEEEAKDEVQVKVQVPQNGETREPELDMSRDEVVVGSTYTNDIARLGRGKNGASTRAGDAEAVDDE
jgi:hypothetical protein